MFDAVIATKYLGTDGETLMGNDAQRIQNEIAVLLRAAKAAEHTVNLAAAELAELTCLQAKYPMR